MKKDAYPIRPMADKENNQTHQPGSLNGSEMPLRKPDEDPIGKVYDSRLMRRLSRYVRPYWLQAGISSLAVCLKSLCDVAGPILVMVAVDRYLAPEASAKDAANVVAHWVANSSPLARVLPSGAVPGVTRLAVIYLALLISAYLFEVVQVYLMQWTGQKIMFDLRRDIFRHMQRMHVGFFDTHPVGRLVTRLTSDVDAINDMFTDGILSIVNDIFMLSIMAAVMLAISWWLALLAFCVLPLILVVTRIFRDHVRESYRRVRTAIARINSFTQEHISGMSVVQLFNREDRAYKDFEAVNRQHMVAFIDTIFAYALYYPAVELPLLRRHRSRGLAWRIRRAASAAYRHRRCPHHVHAVFAAFLAAHPGPERQVQHSPGCNGRLRAHLQAVGLGAGDREPRASCSRRWIESN